MFTDFNKYPIFFFFFLIDCSKKFRLSFKNFT